MRCQKCSTVLVGKYCHNCGSFEEEFTKFQPLSFAEIAEVFSGRPDADEIVARCGDNRINAIKMYREVSGLGLKEAKDIIDVAFFKVYPERRQPYDWR